MHNEVGQIAKMSGHISGIEADDSSSQSESYASENPAVETVSCIFSGFPHERFVYNCCCRSSREYSSYSADDRVGAWRSADETISIVSILNTKF